MKRNNDIKNYLRGVRKGVSANRLEREALSDPFLYEALEGLTSTPGDPIDGLIRLERQLNERGRGMRKKSRNWLYIAASLLVLAMCGTLWGVWLQDGSGALEQELAVADTQKTPSEDVRSMLSMGNVPPARTEAGNPAGVADSIPRGGVREIQAKAEVPVSNDTGRSDVSRLRMSSAVLTNTVKGVVTDEKENVLPGVTIIVTGTNFGTVTDEQGAFQLELPEGKTHLTFQFVGMKAQGVTVKAGTRVDVKMEESQRELEDVVVAGYKTVKKTAIVGAVTTVMGGVADTTVSAGDVDRFNRHMAVALKYPEVDVEKGNEGVILASFELNKGNMPSRIRIKEGFSKESNKELIRLLLESPKWESSLSGKRIYVSVRFTIGKNGAKHSAVLVREKSWD